MYKHSKREIYLTEDNAKIQRLGLKKFGVLNSTNRIIIISKNHLIFNEKFIYKMGKTIILNMSKKKNGDDNKIYNCPDLP